MGKLTVLALRVVLVALLAGSLFVQTVMVVLLARDLLLAQAVARDAEAERLQAELEEVI